MMKRCFVLSLAAIAALCLSCRHHPVYPEIGTLYITSVPSRAEVLIDGVMTYRMTPLKLDGVAAGDHELRVRYAGCKVWVSTVAVQGGMTKRVVAKLASIHPQFTSSCAAPWDSRAMAFEPASGRIYVATNAHFLSVFQYAQGSVSPAGQIWLLPAAANVPLCGQKLIAVSPAANKIYVVMRDDSLVVVDFTTNVILKRFQLADTNNNIVQMRFSENGRTVFLADSLNRCIWLIDAARDSVTGRLPQTGSLPGAPRDFLYDASRGQLYVAMSNPDQLIAIDASSGAQLHSVSGQGWLRLGGLVPDKRWERITCCVHGIADSSSHPFIVDLGNWSITNGPHPSDGNDKLVTAFIGGDQTHMWVVTSFTPWWDENDHLHCQPGFMSMVYLPEQVFVTRFELHRCPVAAAQTADGKYLLVLNGLADLDDYFTVYRTDTE